MRVLAQAARRSELVGAVAQQVASMAACEAVYRRLADGALPPRQLRREWVATFVAGTFAPAQEQVGSRSIDDTAPGHCSGRVAETSVLHAAGTAGLRCKRCGDGS